MPTTELAHDMSVLGLVLQADIIVKIVLVILVLASFWCWTIIFDKLLKMRRLSDQAAQFEEAFWSGGSLEDLYDRIGNRPAGSAISARLAWRPCLLHVCHPGRLCATGT